MRNIAQRGTLVCYPVSYSELLSFSLLLLVIFDFFGAEASDFSQPAAPTATILLNPGYSVYLSEYPRVPICPAGLPMRRHSYGKNGRLIFNCPVKRPTHLDGKTIWQSHLAECPHQVLCQPETKMGPVVYIRSDSDPRLYPKIARDSPLFKQLYNLRSGCERSNATKKVVHKLERRTCRSATHYLVRLYLIGILEHAKVWLAEDRKTLGDDWRVLSDPEKIKLLAKAPPG
jgi:hypothetical protein